MLERDSKLIPEESCPGKWKPAACTRYPVVASIATRPCFSSAARNQRKVSSLPRVARPRGSNPLRGAVAPLISERAERGAGACCVEARGESDKG